MPTVDEQNLAERERLLQKSRKLRDAAVAVFGPPSKRTPHGQLLLEELERFSNYRKPIETLDTTGRLDTHRYMIAVGRREVLQTLHNLIEWKEHPDVDPSSSSP
jgi:hypothetical protein